MPACDDVSAAAQARFPGSGDGEHQRGDEPKTVPIAPTASTDLYASAVTNSDTGSHIAAAQTTALTPQTASEALRLRSEFKTAILQTPASGMSRQLPIFHSPSSFDSVRYSSLPTTSIAREPRSTMRLNFAS